MTINVRKASREIRELKPPKLHGVDVICVKNHGNVNYNLLKKVFRTLNATKIREINMVKEDKFLKISYEKGYLKLWLGEGDLPEGRTWTPQWL